MHCWFLPYPGRCTQTSGMIHFLQMKAIVMEQVLILQSICITHMHPCIHTHTHTRAHAHTHTRTHTHIHAHTHAHTHTHTHTHTSRNRSHGRLSNGIIIIMVIISSCSCRFTGLVITLRLYNYTKGNLLPWFHFILFKIISLWLHIVTVSLLP